MTELTNKLINLNSLKDIDYKKLGLKCGLEIHQQLNTNKLFCNCPSNIIDNQKLTKSIKRRLRFSQSETGEIDEAANDEFKKDKYNIYRYNNECACLIELDEQPPIGPNKQALEMALKISIMFNLTIFNKLQFMRKLIIDGSVTTGFQKTALLGIHGEIQTSFGKVEIEGVNLEEDSCRNLERHDNYNVYSLDRQGIPLIEITTGPQIKTAQDAQETAKILGNYLRSFSETKRGLGTIRQDLNVSIIGGTRVEIKGAQNLKLIPEIIDAEIRRQKIHLSIIEELKNRNINMNNFSDFKIYDITKIFKNTSSKVIIANLENENSSVLAIKLNKFKGILGHELNTNFRFASEISDKNKKHFPTIKGLFHSDELPKYGITEKEIEEINKQLKCEKQDSFILIANDKQITEKSLNNIFNIIKTLITEIPTEVRQVDPKGTLTRFSRPMPGAARMYPETDIKEIEITETYLNKLKKTIPELYDKKIQRLSKQWNLDENKIIEIVEKYGEDNFNKLLKNNNFNLKSSQIYNLLFELPKEIKKREKLEIIKLNLELIKQILELMNNNKLNKNNLYKLLINLYETKTNNIENLEKYLEQQNLITKQIENSKIEQEIKEIIKQNKEAPFGALMGLCMKKFKGEVDGKIISQILKKLN